MRVIGYIAPLVSKNNAWTTVFDVGAKRFRLKTNNIESDAPYSRDAAKSIVTQSVVVQNGVAVIPTNVCYYWDNGAYVVDVYQITGV
ncbi:hypothetical protein BGZ95_010952 [Linnemannia exigua]|uniref:Uncharacterized protein n=1 Tax=Linnemannia exigua TaxID=604196 RepID=A0AAD4DK33_9FUNG|nr:hypothetical protein BGZ95_010952 [Linnemannia exigua]